MCDVRRPLGFDEADGESSEPGYVFRTVSCAYSAPILVVIPVDHIVTAILYAPVVSIGGENGLGIGLLWRLAGDAICELARALAGLLFNAVAFDGECLANVWKVKITVELRSGPDLAGFDPAMIHGRMIGVVGLRSVAEMEFDV